MSVIATAVRHLMAAGVTGEALLIAIEEMEAEVRAEPKPRSAAALRQERYRHNKASRVTESDACDVTPPCPRPLSPQTPQTPTPIPPDITTRARGADSFPCPDWAETAVWRDLKANRQRKRLANTATAHAKLCRDILAMADDEWPPGRLLEAIVARGWGAAYDPREKRNDRKPSDDDQIRNPYARVAARQAAGAGQPSG